MVIGVEPLGAVSSAPLPAVGPSNSDRLRTLIRVHFALSTPRRIVLTPESDQECFVGYQSEKSGLSLSPLTVLASTPY